MGLVCLDVDGCLVDSREMILRSMQRGLVSLGLAPITEEDLTRFVGPPLHETVQLILAERDGHDVEPDALVDAYRDDFRRTCLDSVATYPGVPEAVAALAEAHTLAVVTSKPIPFARPLLDALDLSRHFAFMEGPDLAENESKVTTLRRAIQRAGVRPGREHVMVGDRRHDVEAGAANGLSTIGVTWGFGTGRPEHEAAGADRIVDDADGLLAAVAELTG